MPSLALARKLYFSGWLVDGWWMAGLTVIMMLLSPAGAWAELGNKFKPNPCL